MKKTLLSLIPVTFLLVACPKPAPKGISYEDAKKIAKEIQDNYKSPDEVIYHQKQLLYDYERQKNYVEELTINYSSSKKFIHTLENRSGYHQETFVYYDDPINPTNIIFLRNQYNEDTPETIEYFKMVGEASEPTIVSDIYDSYNPYSSSRLGYYSDELTRILEDNESDKEYGGEYFYDSKAEGSLLADRLMDKIINYYLHVEVKFENYLPSSIKVSKTEQGINEGHESSYTYSHIDLSLPEDMTPYDEHVLS